MRIGSQVEIGFMPEAAVADKKTTSSARTPEEARLLSACQGFEAIILRQLLAAARPADDGDGIFGRSFAREMYESMQDDVMAAKMAKSGGIGLAETLYRQLSAPPAAAEGSKLDGVA